MTLFTNKVTFWGTRGYGLNIGIWGTHSSTQNNITENTGPPRLISVCHWWPEWFTWEIFLFRHQDYNLLASGWASLPGGCKHCSTWVSSNFPWWICTNCSTPSSGLVWFNCQRGHWMWEALTLSDQSRGLCLACTCHCLGFHSGCWSDQVACSWQWAWREMVTADSHCLLTAETLGVHLSSSC